MKPRFDERVKRPGGKRYDMGAPTDLEATFRRIRREQAESRDREAEAERERSRKVRKIA